MNYIKKNQILIIVLLVLSISSGIIYLESDIATAEKLTFLNEQHTVSFFAF